MRLALRLFLFILIAFPGFCFASGQNAALAEYNWGDDLDVTVQDHGVSGLTLSMTLPSSIEYFNSQMRESHQQDKSLEDLPESEFPVITRWVYVPSNGEISVTILDQEGSFAEFDDGISTLRRINDQKRFAGAVQLDNLNPPSPVTIGKSAYLRGHRLVPVSVYPLQVAGDGSVAFENHQLTVDLSFSENHLDNPGFNRRMINSHMARILESTVLNPPPRDLAPTELSRMLIVHSDLIREREATDAIDQFADWKRRMGYTVDIEPIDVENEGQEGIKDIVQGYYEDDPPLDYLVIVGWDSTLFGDDDIDEDEDFYFPPFKFTIQDFEDQVNVRGDLFYTTFDGDEDVIQDVQYGRMMVPNTEDLAGAVRRSILYESDPYPGPQNHEGEWYRHVLVTSEHDTLIPPSTEFLINWELDNLGRLGYDEIDLVWQYETYPEYIDPVREVLEEGVSLVLSDGWTLGAIDHLDPDEIAENGRMNPFVIMDLIHYGQPIIPRWYHSATVDQPLGPIAAFGLDRDPYDEKIFPILGWSIWAMNHLDIWVGGDLHLFSNLHLLAISDRQIESDPRLIEQMGFSRYIGDPTTSIYNEPPVEISCDAPDEFNEGATGVVLSFTDGDDQPVEEVTVCIRQVDEFRYLAKTDADGLVTFTVPDGLVEGELQITAYKHNYHPFVTDIEVVEPPVNLVLQTGGFDDSEQGDDDDEFRNGETVELVLSIRNNGDQDASDITAEFSSDSPFITFSGDNVAVEDIDAGQTGSLEEQVEMTLDADCPGGTVIQIGVHLVSGDDSWDVAFEFTSAGPILFAAGFEIHNLIPGGDATIGIILHNAGTMPVGNIEAELVSLDEMVTVTAGNRVYDGIDPNGDQHSDQPFEVSVDPQFVPGQVAEFELNLSSQDEHDLSLSIGLHISAVEVTDPLGPDGYGYLCFDSGDVDWPEAPVYNWREINYDVPDFEFYGNRVDLVDELGGHWDTTRAIELPFNFRYYGSDYDSITVCSNGWAAMGTEAVSYPSPFNLQIPGYGSPKAMIAPLWQRINNEQYLYNGVYTHYIEEEEIFVIEWSNVQVQDPQGVQYQTFQMLLYNPEVYITPTGDGEIVFQYKQFSPARGNEDGFYFATVGISNLDGSDGLEYSYWDEFPPQAMRIENETALKFTTTVRNLTGSVRGRVVREDDLEVGIADAIVNPVYTDPETTDVDGWFQFDNLRYADYDHVAVSAPGFNTAEFGFEVIPGEQIVLDAVTMTHPELFIPEEHRELTPSLRPDGSRTHVDVRLLNTGTGPLTYSSKVHYFDGTYPAYDTLSTLHLTPLINVERLRCFGVEYIDSLFYIPGRSSIGDFESNPQIFVFNWEGEIIRNFRQPTPRDDDEAYMKGITWDGELLWGAYESLEGEKRIVGFDLEGNLSDTMDYPFEVFQNFSITYSPERNSYFAGDKGTDIVELDSVGNIIGRFPVHFARRDADLSALGWNSYDIEGMPLYIIDGYHETAGRARPTLIKMNPETGAWRVITQLHMTDENVKGYFGMGIIHNHDLQRSYLAIIEGLGLWRSANDHLKIHEIGPNISFMVPGSYVNMTGEIVPQISVPTGFEVDATDWPQGSYQWSYYITHNTNQDAVVVPVTLTVDDESGFDDIDHPVPTEFGLKAVYPNPFNAVARILFALDVSSRVSVRVYDLAGREIATVYENTAPAGVHILNWDASRLSSGVYYVRLEKGSQNSSMKVVLIK